jgi:hypothetical protein
MCGDDDRPDAWAVSTTVEPTTVKRIQPAVRRWPAALTLAILAPLIAEPWRRIDPCQQGLDITVLRLRLQRRIRITWTQPHIWSSSGCWPLPSSPGAAQSSGGTARPADTAYPITRGHRAVSVAGYFALLMQVPGAEHSAYHRIGWLGWRPSLRSVCWLRASPFAVVGQPAPAGRQFTVPLSSPVPSQHIRCSTSSTAHSEPSIGSRLQ